MIVSVMPFLIVLARFFVLLLPIVALIFVGAQRVSAEKK